MSHRLTARGIDHAVLERGRVGQRWSERRASLRLLTPNWMTRLPGHRYDGPDPDGFLCRDQVVDLLQRLRPRRPTLRSWPASRSRASRPALGATAWRPIAASGSRAPSSSPPASATGRWCLPSPAGLDPRVRQVTADRFDGADDLADGGVLVVGAAATGPPDRRRDRPLRASGDARRRAARPRAQALSRPRHHALARRLRRPDRAAAAGVDDGRPDAVVPARRRQRRHRPRHRRGGRSARRRPARRGRGHAARPRRLARRRDGRGRGSAGPAARPDRRACVAARARRPGRRAARPGAGAGGARASSTSRPRASARSSGRRAMRATTGGSACPCCGPTASSTRRAASRAAPGLFALGLPFMRRRNSTFIDGVGADAEEIAAAVACHLGATAARAA